MNAPLRTADPMKPARYDSVSIVLHALTILLLAAMFGTVWARDYAADGDAAADLMNWHRTLGLLVWGATVLRLGWKVAAGRAPSLPASMPRLQRYAARINEGALYLLLVLQPLTGILQGLARGKPVSFVGFDLAALIARNKPLSHLAHDLHQAGANLLLLLIAMHAAAALFHGLVRRDGVFSSMFPTGHMRANPNFFGDPGNIADVGTVITLNASEYRSSDDD